MKIKKKHLVQYGCAVLSLLICGVLSGIGSTLRLESQMAAERWETDGDLSYAQMSVFLGEEAALTDDLGITEAIDSAMVAASLETDAKDTRLWYSAYSTQLGQMELTGTKRTSSKASVTAIGGDFFTLHPMMLLDGNYITENDLMQDRVVVDETLAWQLFGSSNISGMEVIINDTICIVAGVVRPEADYATKKAYGETPRLYIPYTLYEAFQTQTMESTYISCYEAVLPNPVRGFAEKTITEAIGERDCMHILQNTNRSALSRRWDNLRHIHEMLVIPDSVAYPYWENAARIVDYDLAVLLGFEIVFLIFPIFCGLQLLWKGYRWLNQFLHDKRVARKYQYRSKIPQV